MSPSDGEADTTTVDDDASALAIVVPKPDAETTIDSLRAEERYDPDRAVREWDAGHVAVPVTEAPEATPHREVVRDYQEPRERTLADHLREAGWTDAEIERAPGSWAVVGTVILVEIGDDVPRPAEELGDALLALHGNADTVLAREGISGPHREPEGRVIAGSGDTETVHREHGTAYALDLSEVMFSPGNQAERARMGEVVHEGERSEPSERASGETASHERVLDAFAGIGYFALPMARAGADVTAVERNPAAFRYLLENAALNEVTDQIHPYRADCREVAPAIAEDPVDRLVMGYYDAHEYLDALLPALRSGGVVHLHEATPGGRAPERPIERLERAASALGRTVDVLDWRRVKGYSEGVDHVVVDARIG